MIDAGVDALYRNKILGRAFEAMDRRYLVVTDDTLREAMEIYPDWLGNEIRNLHQILDPAKQAND